MAQCKRGLNIHVFTTKNWTMLVCRKFKQVYTCWKSKNTNMPLVLVWGDMVYNYYLYLSCIPDFQVAWAASTQTQFDNASNTDSATSEPQSTPRRTILPVRPSESRQKSSAKRSSADGSRLAVVITPQLLRLQWELLRIVHLLCRWLSSFLTQCHQYAVEAWRSKQTQKIGL